MSENQGPTSPSRRKVIQGVAWSAPIIATAVAAPLAAASERWNVAVGQGCLIGIVGLDLLPGFRITETTNTLPPATLTLTQSIVYSGSYNFVFSAGEGVQRTAAQAIGTTNLGLYFVAGIVSSLSSNATATAFSGSLASSTYQETGRGSNGLGGTRVDFTMTRSRTITVTNLGAGGSAGIGYLISAGVTLPGASVRNVLTANPGSGGLITTDNSATLDWDLLSLGC
ncbi:hypothetical protein [Pseudoclavibacter sp. Z016]|uniref:hypothetical protein n=1 Tax=Pseudoclavibacter sp. Z016 TaxID=2080581 RepID=UPI000CE73F85|nr:hypothetical protein [Pseudoclavibacter sp. Z016]PPF74885.1 hypothetical protein C5B99_12100 [Pseudoclavibacter sp. Z016]